ncbi:glycosyltransferase family 1 protein [Stigmatella sp. ncwal1]|uniref:Glycosyltransferase family 1 protein n=1 Tax=Stigmatella ashevillensis TaxID=2995309 RepID=A0ABT5D5A6_9BACT|nr:glycosyltransferase family 1 protein [Stigmatella ashevillena]MDC0708313.1 glycosyltransferase family 1 protein [Stigmatella ashevillena]
MATHLELLFVSTQDAAADVERLRAVLTPRPEGLTRISFACPTPTLDRRLVEAVPQQSLPWEALHGTSAVQAVNRALLLGREDVLLLAHPLVALGGAVVELRAVLAENDRACALVPTPDYSGFDESERARWLEESRLPRAVCLPTPDLSVVLLSRAVLDMVGTLDETLGSLEEALSDWCLRAQRLGFITLRASRALFRPNGPLPSDLPDMSRLDARHPYFRGQREVSLADMRTGLAARTVASARGDLSVCLDIRYLPEDAINGTSVYAIELCRAMTQHTSARLSLYVGTEKQRKSLEPLGLPIYVNSGLPDHVQLLHRPAQVFSLPHLQMLLHAQVPYILSYQDLISYRAGSVWPGGEDQARYQLASYVAVRGAQGLIAISDHNRREVIREFHVPEEHVHTVHHGVDMAAFARQPTDDSAGVLQPLGLPRRFFLFIGSDYAHKNVKLLLAAYVNFRARWKGHGEMPGLVLVGHPSGTQDGVFPFLRQQPLPGVHFVGGVSHPVLRALYHQAIAYMYLSAYEGFGLPLLEAMAAETPILCSRFSSIPEVAGDAVLYADTMSDLAIAGQMIQLAEEPSLGRTLAAKGKARVAQFTWKQTALKTYEAYREVLRRPSLMSLTDRRFLKEFLSRPLLP